MHIHLTVFTVSTSWLSFGTARRRVFAPSHFERGLKPARPGLSLGVFRRFGTMASIRAVASPNEVLFSATLYYRILLASREKEKMTRLSKILKIVPSWTPDSRPGAEEKI